MNRVILATLLFTAIGCDSTSNRTERQKTQEEPLAITRVALLKDEKGKPGAEVSQFDYRQLTLRFQAILNHPVEGKKGRWIFRAKSTSAGNDKDLSAVESEINGDSMFAQVSLPSPWPVGTYHVVVVVDEKPIHEFDYIVTGEKSRIVFLGHTLSPDNGKGLPSVQVKSFKPSERIIHIQVTSKGVDTTQPEIVWKLYRLVNNQDVELASIPQPKMQLQDSVLKCQFQSGKDWDKGDYRTDIFMDGKKVHEISFKVSS